MNKWVDTSDRKCTFIEGHGYEVKVDNSFRQVLVCIYCGAVSIGYKRVRKPK